MSGGGGAGAGDPRALAEAVNTAKLATLGMLVAGVAHEINTPLGAINSNHDTLKRAISRLQQILADEMVSAEELEEVRRVVRALDSVLHVNDLAVERMRHLVHSLRTFGRLDRSELDTVDLREGLESTLLILGHELRQVRVVRDYADLPPLRCHPQRLNQVFMNLILNATQALPEGGSITIRTRADADAVTVEIEDTGVGMPAEQLARLFEPGFTTKGKRIGMGMGLLICRELVEQHDGSIEVRSAPGVGTCFTIRLPFDNRIADRTPGTSSPLEL